MTISSDIIRGHLESVILTLIKEKDRYAYEIASEIKTRTEGTFTMKEATLYAMVQRLEKKGVIESYIGDKSHGKKRRYYYMTSLGDAYLETKQQEWYQLKAIMARFLEDTNESN